MTKENDSNEGLAGAIREVERLVWGNRVDIDIEHTLPGIPKTIPVGVDHTTGRLYSIKNLLEDYREKPWRKRGTAKTRTLESFIALVTRHKTDASALFLDALGMAPALTAVIDYHHEEPAFGGHRVLYEFPLTDDFKAWLAHDGKPMSQTEFAEFLEEHDRNLAAPSTIEEEEFRRRRRETVATPTELLQLATELEVRVEQTIKSATRLKSGERVVLFTENHANAQGEAVTIPGVFIISVPIFVEGEPQRIAARLRYKTHGGKLTFSYHLDHAAEAVRDAAREDGQKATTATALPLFEGAPEMAAA